MRSEKEINRVLVCGGREFSNRDALFSALDALYKKHAFALLIHGAARGADTEAGLWARANEVNHLVVPAKWKRLGKSAGPRRNQEMLSVKPDLVVAFPGGAGTEDMIRRATAAGIMVWQPMHNEEQQHV